MNIKALYITEFLGHEKKEEVTILQFVETNGNVIAVCCYESGRLFSTNIHNLSIITK